MAKKYEFLKLPTILLREVKIQKLIKFINKSLGNTKLNSFYMSFDLTLFIYNCVINLDIEIDTTQPLLYVEYVQRIYEALYEKKMTNDEITKLKEDLTYIAKNKMYTKVNPFYYWSMSLYNFFFPPNIYVVEI